MDKVTIFFYFATMNIILFSRKQLKHRPEQIEAMFRAIDNLGMNYVVNEDFARELFANGQVAFQYVDPIDEEVTMESPYNPNGSYYAIEGIISRNGQILGKMGHTERFEGNLFKNIMDEGLEQPLFDNAVGYFRGE